jgi:hypothetical protein
MRALWESQGNAALPAVVVRYPGSLNIAEPAWTGPLAAETVRALVDSPARRELVRRLAAGDSAVWLLLECGDTERDAAAARLLDAESRRLETTLKLPEPAPGDPAISAGLPLKIAFSTLRIAHDDPAERVLLGLLTPAHAEALPPGPRMFAVMGRGRALPPLVGEDLGAERLTFVAEFITGACSCEAKLLNPGFDLLLAADWNAVFDRSVIPVPELPPLTGLSQLAASAASPLASPASSAPIPVPVSSTSGGPDPGRYVILVLVLGVAAAALGTVLLRVRAPGRGAESR